MGFSTCKLSYWACLRSERETYDFLQTINEVANNNTEALELMEEVGQLLTRTLTHHVRGVLRWEVCVRANSGDRGGSIHQFSTHCVQTKVRQKHD